jgi:hypothetical protein
MLTRPYILATIAVVAAAPCLAARPADRDGSTIAKAIPLKERGMKAVAEEMTWMLKLYNYSPVLATHDAIADASSKAKAGKNSVNTPAPWGHGSLDYNGHLISYWWFVTPRGKKEIYFDTGISSDTPGEVAEQDSARTQYMRRVASPADVERATPAPVTYRVIKISQGDYLTVRTGAASNYPVVMKLEPGTGGIVLGANRVTNGETTWQEIIVNGRTGWVNADYIAPATQSSVSR